MENTLELRKELYKEFKEFSRMGQILGLKDAKILILTKASNCTSILDSERYVRISKELDEMIKKLQEPQ